ncbi:hypothetical protein B9479_001082 [Cryptococcus floricola]|uniref:Zn(2)-C6 fungal-type domain-containing protein n=1 Tax=Cryptococcus floricola TaxID=2591691 RepID=A0A5D3B7G0_9TREE|nr:hypothetical protein B9479_001082 [Cryptococcus floricola]
MGYTSEGSGEGSDKRVKRRAPKKSPSVVRRACDACRRKKVRCEGPMNSLANAKCAQCDHFGYECSYLEEASRRKNPTKSYARMLEQRCSRLEMMLQEVYPDVNLDDYVGPPLDFEDFDLDSYQEELRALSIPDYPSLKPLHPVPSPLPASPSPPKPSNALIDSVSFIRESGRGKTLDEIEHAGDDSVVVVNSLRRLHSQHVRWRHHGRASGAHLVCHYQDLKQDAGESGNIFEKLSKDKREDFWQVPEWEQFVSDVGQNALDYSIWPEKGLDQQLINAYFDHVNINVPLLNRHIFQKEYDSGLWKSQQRFGRVCLLIFACGARFYNATGTFWPRGLSATQGQNRDYDEQWLPYSAGWKYLRMALHMGHNLLYMPDLHELQSQVLICYFLQSSTTPQMSAHLAGSALRSSQEIGIHLTTVLERLEPTERELYKRAFWCLYHFDRFSCAMVGRSVAMTDNDLDAPFPEDVDDEYWSIDGRASFKQPEGKVSKVAMFIQLLKLDQILGKVLQLLYSARQDGSRQATRRAFAIELDLALEEWVHNVPEALRWDPNCSNFTIFQQASCIWGYHGFVKMLIHRDFIPLKRKVATIDQLSSLASCVTAALSICSISKAVLQRGRQEDCQPGHCLDVSFKLPSWLAGTILLVSIYTVEQTAVDRQAAEDGIRACLEASRELEIIWKQGGKVSDFLAQFLKETETPNPRRLEDGSGGDYKSPEESMCFTPSSGFVSVEQSSTSHKWAQRGLFESWKRLNTFESQLFNMNRLSGDAESEETLDGDWWGKVMNDQIGPDLYNTWI